MNTHNHSQECSGVHIGAHCLPKNDLRGAIVSLTSRMLDNPDKSGIYSTTKFYDDLEQFIRSSFAEYRSELAAKIEALGVPIKKRYGIMEEDGQDAELAHNAALDQVLKILEL